MSQYINDIKDTSGKLQKRCNKNAKNNEKRYKTKMTCENDAQTAT